MLNRVEEVKEFANNLAVVEVSFKELSNGEVYGHIFYSYETFGKWYADNYDSIEVMEIK